jgi:peroxiredoxin
MSRAPVPDLRRGARSGARRRTSSPAARWSLAVAAALAAAASPATAAPSAPARSDAGKPAAQAPATAAVGKPAPAFALKDLAGKEVSLAAHKGKIVVLEWINPGCPFVKKAHTAGSLVDAAQRHAKAGVVWLAINSGAPGKQAAEPAANAEAAKVWSLAHPILLDPTGAVGRAYGATNTPHMFVIDKAGVLVYAGAIDNSPDGEGKSPEGGKLVSYVDAALADLAAGRPVRTASTKAYGCTVKYGS